jgi:hypothetical protein
MSSSEVQHRPKMGPDPHRRHLRVLDVAINIVEKGLTDGRKLSFTWPVIGLSRFACAGQLSTALDFLAGTSSRQLH